MRLRTPYRWYRRDPPRLFALGLLARPLALLWTLATARRMARGRPLDPGVPVICVGGLTMGGVGKTPVVRELARRLRAAGLNPQILMRGHGGRLHGPTRVDVETHSAADVGDEALMLARDGPVWVARDRAAGAKAAAAAGARIIIMDDGHQNPSVRKALSLVVVDGETRDGEWPFGDGAVFPAGPLREPLAAGLARADAVVVVLPADVAEPEGALLALFAGKPVLSARLSPLRPPPPGPQLGFAGIGKPWKLERALRAAGCDLVDFAPLADHQHLGEGLLNFLDDRAKALGAGLITTEKDWVRLPAAWQARITAWPVRAEFTDDQELDALLAPAVPISA